LQLISLRERKRNHRNEEKECGESQETSSHYQKDSWEDRHEEGFSEEGGSEERRRKEDSEKGGIAKRQLDHRRTKEILTGLPTAAKTVPLINFHR
jgi:hypothetical protein